MSLKIRTVSSRFLKKNEFTCGDAGIDDFFNGTTESTLKWEEYKTVSKSYLLINDHKQLIGFFTLSPYLIHNKYNRPNKDLSKLGEITAIRLHMFAIKSNFQRQGNGTLMMLEVLKLYRRLVNMIGSECMVLYTTPSSAAFYEKFGIFKKLYGRKGVIYAHTCNILSLLEQHGV